MQTIWKYKVEIKDKFSLNLPVGAIILCVQIDQKDGNPYIWCQVENNIIMGETFFEVFGTGNEMHNDIGVERNYIGTFQKDGFVWHLFERP